MKRRKIRQNDKRDVQGCIDQLQALIEGLRAGEIVMQTDGDSVLLAPGAVVDFELRVEQLTRKETLRVEMSWQREPAGAVQSVRPAEVPAPTDATPIQATRPERDGLVWTRAQDRFASEEHQHLYAAARVLDSDGHYRIDQDRLMQSLESAGVDPLTQQELYALALQADADGRGNVLSERVIEAIKRVSQIPPSNAAE
jgi:amphi-Trp domain-containing protein